MLRLTDISITRSSLLTSPSKVWVMQVTVMTPMGEMQSTQHFEDFGGFLTAVKEMGTFFAVRLGRIKSSEANARLITRPIAPNPHGTIQ